MMHSQKNIKLLQSLFNAKACGTYSSCDALKG